MSDYNELGRALSLMKEALCLLDQCGAATEAGAHLDLAIHRLENAIRSVHGIVPSEVVKIVTTKTA